MARDPATDPLPAPSRVVVAANVPVALTNVPVTASGGVHITDTASVNSSSAAVSQRTGTVSPAGYPYGTVITDQFKSQGVLLSAQNFQDGFGPAAAGTYLWVFNNLGLDAFVSTELHDSDARRFSGRFVNPANGASRNVYKCEVNVAGDFYGPATFYDVNQRLISTQNLAQTGQVQTLTCYNCAYFTVWTIFLFYVYIYADEPPATTSQVSGLVTLSGNTSVSNSIIKDSATVDSGTIQNSTVSGTTKVTAGQRIINGTLL